MHAAEHVALLEKQEGKRERQTVLDKIPLDPPSSENL